MTLPELIAAATVLMVAAGGSLQVWSASLAASQQAEQQQGQLMRIEAQLWRSHAGLRVAAEQQLASAAGAMACPEAAAWLAQQLTALQASAPLDLEAAVEPQSEALVQLVLRDPATGLERRRRWSPVAFGLCGGRDGGA